MNPEEHLWIIKKNTVEIVQEKELLIKIRRKGSLKVKFGVDPTTSDIHLGHSVVLLKLKSFQELGHQVVLLIGDSFSAGSADERRILTPDPVLVMAKAGSESA